jgi:hypothetical protein
VAALATLAILLNKTYIAYIAKAAKCVLDHLVLDGLTLHVSSLSG